MVMKYYTFKITVKPSDRNELITRTVCAQKTSDAADLLHIWWLKTYKDRLYSIKNIDVIYDSNDAAIYKNKYGDPDEYYKTHNP